MSAPRVLLLDLDDTILDDSSLVHECWDAACCDHEAALISHDRAAVVRAIRDMSRWFWSDAERHRTGRLEIEEARREVVRLAFARLGIEDRALAAKIGDSYSAHRDARMAPLPDAIDTVRWAREAGHRLALITNGGGTAQRKKIERFGLAGYFDAILVEGEVGFGKPDPRVYRLALESLEAGPADAWMVGDNFEFDVAAPKRLGIRGIWLDVRRAGLPPGVEVAPDHIVHSLAEIRPLLLA